MMKLILAITLYGATFHYAYVVYINPKWEYAHYTYFVPSIGGLLLTYVLLAAPVVFRKKSESPAAIGASLILALYYVPAQLVLLFTWQRAADELAWVQTSLAISMAIILRVSSLGAGSETQRQLSRGLSVFVGTLTVVSGLILIWTYGQSMRFVSFEDVYKLRFETNEIERLVLSDYLFSWFSYCFIPFYLARGITQRRITDLGIGILGSLLAYTSTGSKAGILMPGIVCIMYLLIVPGKDFALRLLVALTASIAFIVTTLPDDGLFAWIKSIVLVRIVGSNGWILAAYYDYFSTNGYTYYTHIGPVGRLFGGYPYGDLGLGQVIGLQYSGTSNANFNGGFWASDAFAAWGILGVPIVTAALCAVLVLLNRAARGYPSRLIAIWLSGFWLALLNVPLSTALLSGGGLIVMLLLWLHRHDRQPGADRRRLGVGPASSRPQSVP